MLELVRNPRVLLVEGNHNARRAMRASLRRVGHDVDSFEWIDAANPALEARLDYLVCGRVAAGDTSLALMQSVAATQPETTRVLLVNQVDQDVRQALYTGLIDGVIVRPFSPEALPERLSRFANTARVQPAVPTPVEEPRALWSDWLERIRGQLGNPV